MATYRVPVLQDFSWQPTVKDKDLTAPPGGEAKGDRYIVASVATGAWAGLENHIVTYDGAAWIDDTPLEGWYVYVMDENSLYHYTGAAWDIDDISAIEGDITSIDTRVSNVESSAGSIDTKCGTNSTNISTNASTNVVQDASIDSLELIDSANLSTEVADVASIDLVTSANASVDVSQNSSIVSIDTRATNIESSAGSINTALDGKQSEGVYVSEYGAIEFTI